MNKRDRTRHVRASLRPDGRPGWYQIDRPDKTRNGPGGSIAADVHIYDEIGGWGVTASDFVRDLATVSATEINVHINSPGGDVWDGIAIHNAIKNHKAQINVRVDGLAASAASFIAMAGDSVVIEPNAQMMIHDALCAIVGNAAELRELADMLDRTSDSIAGMYAAKAGGKAATWREAMKIETWYNAEEAKAAGLADSIAGAEEGDDEEPEVEVDLAAVAPVPFTMSTSIDPATGAQFGQFVDGKHGTFRWDADTVGVWIEVATVDRPPAPDPVIPIGAELVGEQGPEPVSIGRCESPCCNPEVGPVDSEALQAAFDLVANDAPAEPDVPRLAPYLPPIPAAPAPEPEPEPGPFDMGVFVAAMQLAANDAPMQVDPARPEPPAAFDTVAFLSSLKEAAK